MANPTSATGNGAAGRAAPIGVGVLTKGKPTLSMVLVSLLLQEGCPLRIHIVDTAPSPVVKRDDVVFALRLAFDRGIVCEYEYTREKDRAFSAGRQRLVEALPGPNLVLMDDDVVLPSGTLARLQAHAASLNGWGYVTPLCKNYGMASVPHSDHPQYTPGGLIFQDDTVRRLLLEYYGTTVDVLDTRRAREKVWETVFLSELFPALGRPCVTVEDCTTFHLDYHQGAQWHPNEAALVAHTRQRLRDLLARHQLTPAS